MTNIISTVAAAVELKVSVRTVQLHCRELAVDRVGRDYLITPQVLKTLKARIKSGPGRPRLVK